MPPDFSFHVLQSGMLSRCDELYKVIPQKICHLLSKMIMLHAFYVPYPVCLKERVGLF